jgi:hypothetical protein
MRGDTVGTGRERDHGCSREAGRGPCRRHARAGLRAGGHACESGWLGRSGGSPVGLTFGSR